MEWTSWMVQVFFMAIVTVCFWLPVTPTFGEGRNNWSLYQNPSDLGVGYFFCLTVFHFAFAHTIAIASLGLVKAWLPCPCIYRCCEEKRKAARKNTRNAAKLYGATENVNGSSNSPEDDSDDDIPARSGCACFDGCRRNSKGNHGGTKEIAVLWSWCLFSAGWWCVIACYTLMPKDEVYLGRLHENDKNPKNGRTMVWWIYLLQWFVVVLLWLGSGYFIYPCLAGYPCNYFNLKNGIYFGILHIHYVFGILKFTTFVFGLIRVGLVGPYSEHGGTKEIAIVWSCALATTGTVVMLLTYLVMPLDPKIQRIENQELLLPNNQQFLGHMKEYNDNQNSRQSDTQYGGFRTINLTTARNNSNNSNNNNNSSIRELSPGLQGPGIYYGQEGTGSPELSPRGPIEEAPDMYISPASSDEVSATTSTGGTNTTTTGGGTTTGGNSSLVPKKKKK